MCGRYSIAEVLEYLQERFDFPPPDFSYAPRYNVAPGQPAPVVVGGERRALRLMKWGLIPSWAGDPSIGNRMINARAETLAEKRSFRPLLPHRRCLVVGDGFYEWRPASSGRGKIPIRFVLSEGGPFAFAGLWDSWCAPDGEEVPSFTIVTTAANDLIHPFHDRMPVILTRDNEAGWIDPDLTDEMRAVALLRPYQGEQMRAYEVSTIVNSPRNDSPECIKEITR